MKAKEAAEIAEIAKVRISYEYNNVIKVITAHANNGKREVTLPQSFVPKSVFDELEKDGYECSYSFNGCKILW